MSEEIAEHKQELEDVVRAGHKLESYTDAEPSSLPDIGYTALEERYKALKVSTSACTYIIIIIVYSRFTSLKQGSAIVCVYLD